MFEAILQGIGAGILFSFLTGPVFFSMIKTSIEKGFKAGFSLAVGVIFSDIIFITLTIFSAQFVDYKSEYFQYIGIVGGLFLFGIGLYYLFNKVKVSYDISEIAKVRKRGYILKGFLMCLLSPTTLMFWIMVGGIISVQLHYTMAEKIVFFIIAMATQLSVDGIKTYYAAKLRYRIKEKTIQNLNRIAGAVIIIFAIRLFVEVILKHYK
ncbi:Threonine/homoserine/homoserine lactone efflux protein [Pedobacter steynii]|jgi:threonine/homoserine/homoserine lactone efflux protein|uniref:Threonine/homoserine/homoserine lactone efflux protein n=1 Tax=Pedobacter steynii TaxID=430522 RepID=A0A1H0I8V8_9SPHI|nr:LysE family transporter [Pedobacter steynii]NQX42832.1 LysE family transporter [Pedobacter steynii]SDO27822.1 Threonine/homoserine/homoserine lactone efflux protein [Pedobacter steynii]